MDIISETRPVARKEYRCDASDAFNNVLSERDLRDVDDLATYKLAESEGFRIAKGQKYRKSVYTDGGELRTYRGRLDMDELCTLHEVWDE